MRLFSFLPTNILKFKSNVNILKELGHWDYPKTILSEKHYICKSSHIFKWISGCCFVLGLWFVLVPYSSFLE